jgi:hypothetical protein
MKERKWANKTIRERQEETVARAHAAPSECLICGIRMMPSERRAHRQNCRGRTEVSQRDIWITESQAIDYTRIEVLSRGVEHGIIRSRSGENGREFLLRDVEQLQDVVEWFLFAV